MAVHIHPMLCGSLEVDTKFLLAKEPGRVRIPIPSFLIDHPKGRAIFDTGLHRDLQNGPARIGSLGDVFKIHYRAGEELGARLRAIDVAPDRIDYLINSHLHFDHVGGNADLPNAKLVVQRREWEAADNPEIARRNGYNRADFDLGHQLQLIDGEHDLFGDGSVVLIPTYGHTAGHQSLRVRTDRGEVVLTADSCYMRKVLDEMVLPPFADSYDAMRAVIERFRVMERAGATLIFGHDPAQWNADGSSAVALD
ncbi:MAG: N-acyl homoserine lactonase family protein [Candidatus Binatus sp.]|uniref:N-acyl homoserine lactonase family protein n=1 Tax=Candidatus Binatus sp. TaxID=2811406 RepID=UPI0027202D7E|nr:N-acyl homoserine lactonase family protein [Candidatus Binatus sp.]MDO8431728.1 N-acyl homoserine lactonase family protein [Candidatus Binatus sp.]